MSEPIKKEIRGEILHKIKTTGMSVLEASNLYGVSTKAIYNWLKKESAGVPNVLANNLLRRDNEKLYAIIGKLTAEIERLKKGRK